MRMPEWTGGVGGKGGRCCNTEEGSAPQQSVDSGEVDTDADRPTGVGCQMGVGSDRGGRFLQSLCVPNQARPYRKQLCDKESDSVVYGLSFVGLGAAKVRYLRSCNQ